LKSRPEFVLPACDKPGFERRIWNDPDHTITVYSQADMDAVKAENAKLREAISHAIARLKDGPFTKTAHVYLEESLNSSETPSSSNASSQSDNEGKN